MERNERSNPGQMSISVRLPSAELKRKLTRLAKIERRSVSQYVVFLLERHIEGKEGEK